MALENPLIPRKRTRSTPVGGLPSASGPPTAAPLNAQFRKLQTQYWPIERITPYERELRVHSREQQQQVERNILAFNGPVAAILAKADGTIIDGHLLYAALKALGITQVPVTVIDDLDPVQVAALRISLNKIQEMSTWEEKNLRLEIAYIAEVNVDLLINTAIPTVEIDVLLHPGAKEKAADEADALPEADANAATVSIRGDIWLIKGGHALACGDSRQK